MQSARPAPATESLDERTSNAARGPAPPSHLISAPLQMVAAETASTILRETRGNERTRRPPLGYLSPRHSFEDKRQWSGPPRQGFAPPLRALDRSGPPRKKPRDMRERGALFRRARSCTEPRSVHAVTSYTTARSAKLQQSLLIDGQTLQPPSHLPSLNTAASESLRA
jgi:hypothetical protein